MCFGGVGVGFSDTLGGLIFSGIASESGVGAASVFSFSVTGAGLGASEVRTPVSSVRWVGGRGIDADHGGLDGPDVRSVFAPVAAAVMKEKCPANDECCDESVQQQ